MKNHKNAFTLVEILLAMSVLIVGLAGILSLFPVGLNATKKAIEDTNAALIADSVYSALRAAAQQTLPGTQLRFFFDGMKDNQIAFPSGTKTFKEGDLRNLSFGIPAHGGNYTQAPIAIANYTVTLGTADYCKLAKGAGVTGESYNITIDNTQDEAQLTQYSFNIQISYPPDNPKSLYDVVIRIARGERLIKKFYTQIMIPTAD